MTTSTRSRIPEHALPRAGTPASPGELLVAVVNGWCLPSVVPRTLELVEHDPLASGGCFPGDLVRGLMEVPGSFWARAPRLYARYRDALRACAGARRRLPPEARAEFWEPLVPPSAVVRAVASAVAAHDR